MKTIYICLLNEGTDCWRPVEAEQIDEGLYRIGGAVPAEEEWEFQPGEVVRCATRNLSEGTALVAVESVPR